MPTPEGSPSHTQETKNCFICSDRLSNVTIELYFIVHTKWNFGQHPKVCMYFFSYVTGDYGHNSVTS